MDDLQLLSQGDSLPTLVTAPVTRQALALYAGASGDHNPLHIDIDAARAAGMPDVFAQGMLPMAYLGRFLTESVSQAVLRSFSVRFMAITHLGDRIACSGKVAEVFEMNGQRCLRLSLTAANQAGEIKLSGDAVVSMNQGEMKT